jgi:hypothetical protein
MLVAGMPKNYKLRWKFEYLGGKERCGEWSQRGTDSQQAQNQTRDELIKVHLEALNIRTGHTHRVFTVDAHEFEEFKYRYVASANILGAEGKQTLTSELIEAQLWSKHVVYSMDITGNIRSARKEDFLKCQ